MDIKEDVVFFHEFVCRTALEHLQHVHTIWTVNLECFSSCFFFKSLSLILTVNKSNVLLH